MSIIKGWKNRALIYLFLGLLSGIVGGPVASLAAPPLAAPKMQVRAGYDSYYKQASWLPIQFNLTLSENNPTFNGWVEASQTNFDSNELLIRRNVQLPAPSNRTVWLYMPTSRRYINQIQVRLTDQAGKVIASDKLEVRSLTNDDLLVGVLGNDSALGALNPLNGERLTQPFNTKNELLASAPYQIVTPPNVIPRNQPIAKFVRLAPTDLPPDTAGWESLDGLAVSNLGSFNLADPTLNTEGMRSAAAGWLAQSRFLFVAGDESLRKSGFLADLLPVKPVGPPQNVNFPTSLSKLSGQQAAPPTILLANTSLVNGASPMLSEGNKPILAKRNFGLGVAYFLATEFGGLPSGINKAIWSDSLKDYEPQLTYLSQHRDHDNDYRNWFDLISPSTQLAALPDVLLVFFSLIFYLLVLGPIGYLVLKRTNKREWGWLFAPVLAILLAVSIYVAGRLTEGDPLVISRLTLVVAGETASGKLVGSSASIATIYSNQRTEFQLGIAEDAVSLTLESNRYTSSRNANPILTFQQGTGAKYERINMGLSDRRSFAAQDNNLSAFNNGFRSQLKMDGKDLNGTLENLTGTDWTDIEVWLPGGQVYRVANFKAGDKVSIDSSLIIKSSAKTLAGKIANFEQDNPNRYYGNYNRNNISYSEQRYHLLSSLIGDAGYGVPNDRAYILAWKQTNLNFPLRLEKQGAKQVNLTLFLQTINLQ